jgi:hypothetical protein
MSKAIVTSEDLQGRFTEESLMDVVWWQELSRQQPSAIEITSNANGRFRSVEIEFGSPAAEADFMYKLEKFGVHVDNR